MDQENVVRLLDVRHDDHKSYIFMEYCSEGDLKSFIKHFKQHQNTLREDEARYVIKQITKGLKYLLGQQNVIHRDIKIENILVHKKEGLFEPGDIRQYTFKIGDMGLAKKLESPHQL